MRQVDFYLVHLPPDVRRLAERGTFDDFRRHPSICAGSAHVCGFIDLSSQAKVRYQKRLIPEIFVSYHLPY